MATNVILLERVRNLGNLGDEVSVKPGYARNYLVPFGKAVPANDANRKVFEERRAELEAREAEQLGEAQGRANAIGELAVTISARASDEGRLYGSVGTREIADAIQAACGQEVDKSEVLLPEGALRAVGEYEVEIQLHTDLRITVAVAVIPE